MTEDFEALADERIRQINEQVAAAQERAEAAQAMSQEITQVVGRAESRRGEVLVEVDSAGRLSHLEFSDEALRLGRDSLASLVLYTAGEAQADAGRQVMGLVRETFGEDTQVTEQLTDAYVTENPHAQLAENLRR